MALSDGSGYGASVSFDLKHIKSNIEIFDTLGSTQDEALDRLRSGQKRSGWIMARQQYLGRGRQGRNWHSGHGNLMASFYRATEIEIHRVPQLAILMAAAIHDVLYPVMTHPEALKIKWPNDLLINGAKLCGILVQSETLPPIDNNRLGLVIGIGLNLNHAPEIVDTPTACLKNHTHEDTALEPETWLERLDQALQYRWDHWIMHGLEMCIQTWNDHAYGLGRQIMWSGGKGCLVGMTSDGRLKIIDDSGDMVSIHDSDIRFV